MGVLCLEGDPVRLLFGDLPPSMSSSAGCGTSFCTVGCCGAFWASCVGCECSTAGVGVGVGVGSGATVAEDASCTVAAAVPEASVVADVGSNPASRAVGS